MCLSFQKSDPRQDEIRSKEKGVEELARQECLQKCASRRVIRCFAVAAEAARRQFEYLCKRANIR